MLAGPPEIIDVAAGEVDRKLETIPERPAVFLVWPREGAPYLGRTTVLRRRLRRLLGERTAAGRLLNLRNLAVRVEYWLTGSRLAAGLVAYGLATRHFPETFSKLLKLRLPCYVKVILGNAFPRTQVTSRLGGGASLYYGPFRTRVAAEQFESQVLDLFQVRRCQEDLAPSANHPGCIYGEMSRCLRPCQLAATREEYASEVRRLTEFLESDGRSLAEPLEASRERLSQEMDFEAAAREHRQLERIQQVLRLRDDLACETKRLNGVAVTAAVETGKVELWFLLEGCWQPPVQFGFEVVEGKTVSMDQRLREVVAAMHARKASARERQEHAALLVRWYHSSWRDGEWLSFDAPEHAPYRKLVRAISRVAAGGPLTG